MSKFERLIPLFGENGLEKLSKSTVCVVGLGTRILLCEALGIQKILTAHQTHCAKRK